MHLHKCTHCVFAERLDQPAAAWPLFISKRTENHINRLISQALFFDDDNNLTCINPTSGRSQWSALSVWWGWHQSFTRSLPWSASVCKGFLGTIEPSPQFPGKWQGQRWYVALAGGRKAAQHLCNLQYSQWNSCSVCHIALPVIEINKDLSWAGCMAVTHQEVIVPVAKVSDCASRHRVPALCPHGSSLDCVYLVCFVQMFTLKCIPKDPCVNTWLILARVSQQVCMCVIACIFVIARVLCVSVI